MQKSSNVPVSGDPWGEVNVKKGVEQSEANLIVKTSNGSSNSQRPPGRRIVKRASGRRRQVEELGRIVARFSYKLREVKFYLPPGRWLFWSVAFILTATVSATVGATVALMTPVSSLITLNPKVGGDGAKGNSWDEGFQYRLARPVNILIMGIDRVPDIAYNSPARFRGNSDTMLLLRLDSTERSVKMLSIPRDTRVEIPGFGMQKINQANVQGGATLAAQVVNRTLNNVPIDRYVRITTGAFRELVDLVGGVDVFVPEPMSYVDKTQNLNIDLNQGWQTLNGDQAEQFVRFRHDKKGDIGRVQRQQALLKALRQRLQTPALLPRLPQMLQVMGKYIDTNLSLEEMLALVSFGLRLDQDDFKMVLLPGRFSTPREYPASYWVLNPVEKDRLMREYFERNSITASSSVGRSLKQMRIAIQNASGQPQLSRRIANELEQQGFENVYVIDSWPDPQRQTQIIVQQGDSKAAIAFKRVLGFGKVEAASIGDIKSDLTIRLGEDGIDTSK